MKLEGSLDAFGLPDIFQLLSYTKKTGGLHLRNGSVHGVVYFASGAVTGASGDLGRQTLARRLVGERGGRRRRAACGRGQARSPTAPVSGVRSLDAGAVPADVVRQAAADQAVDAVFDLLGWAEGDFSFSVDEGNPDDVGIELSTERVVAEAAARREAADRASAQIASPDVVLAMPVVPPADLELSPDEWALRRARRRPPVRRRDRRADRQRLRHRRPGAGRPGRARAARAHRAATTTTPTAVRRRLALLAPLESAERSHPSRPRPQAAAPPQLARSRPRRRRPRRPRRRCRRDQLAGRGGLARSAVGLVRPRLASTGRLGRPGSRPLGAPRGRRGPACRDGVDGVQLRHHDRRPARPGRRGPAAARAVPAQACQPTTPRSTPLPAARSAFEAPGPTRRPARHPSVRLPPPPWAPPSAA